MLVSQESIPFHSYMAAGVGNTRWLHQGAYGLLQTSQRDRAGVDKLPGKCNRYAVSYFRGRPCMASRYFQQARRNCCIFPQRFGPDLVVFSAASSPCYFSDRLNAVLPFRQPDYEAVAWSVLAVGIRGYVVGRNKSTWHISIAYRFVLLQKSA